MISNHIDYSAVLSDLKQKQLELTNAIHYFEKLVSNGILSVSEKLIESAPSQLELPVNSSEFESIGMYEGAARILELFDKPMKTDEILKALIDKGKKLQFGGNTRSTFASILHKAVKRKNNSKIIKVGPGLWMRSPSASN